MDVAPSNQTTGAHRCSFFRRRSSCIQHIQGLPTLCSQNSCIRKLSYAASVGRVEIRQLWKYTVWSRQTNSPTSNVIRFRNEKEHTRHNQLSSHVDLRITFLHLPDLNALNLFTFQNRSDKRDSKYTSREFPDSYLAMVGACPRTHRERSHVQSEI